MGNNSADQFFPRNPRSHSRAPADLRDRAARGRMPSSTGYLISAIVISGRIVLWLWWILVSGGDEAPWLPAGLAASVVLLVALSAREVVMRRAWTRYLLENGIREKRRVVLASVVAVRRRDFPRRSTPPRCAQFKNSHCC